jgi:hypothetical protein
MALKLERAHLRTAQKWIAVWRIAKSENRRPELPKKSGRNRDATKKNLYAYRPKRILWVPEILKRPIYDRLEVYSNGLGSVPEMPEIVVMRQPEKPPLVQYVDRLWRLGESMQLWLDRIRWHRPRRGLSGKTKQVRRFNGRNLYALYLSRMKGYGISIPLENEPSEPFRPIFDDPTQGARFLRLWTWVLDRNVNYLRRLECEMGSVDGVTCKRMIQYGERMMEVAVELRGAFRDALDAPRSEFWYYHCDAYRWAVGTCPMRFPREGSIPSGPLFPMNLPPYDPSVVRMN